MALRLFGFINLFYIMKPGFIIQQTEKLSRAMRALCAFFFKKRTALYTLSVIQVQARRSVYKNKQLCYLMYMKFEPLVKLVGDMPCFDLQLLVQALDEKREVIRVQLSRFIKQGRIIALRRGMYALSDVYRRVALVPAVLANNLYRPSYLSGLWALSYYDLIPEAVVWLTSVTPRVPRRFENEIGVFEYRNIRQAAFFGYHSATYSGAEILVAEPEKALLDQWHLAPGEWSSERLMEMRYQNFETVDKSRLAEYAERFASPRLRRAAKRWSAIAGGAEIGAMTL